MFTTNNFCFTIWAYPISSIFNQNVRTVQTEYRFSLVNFYVFTFLQFLDLTSSIQINIALNTNNLTPNTHSFRRSQISRVRTPVHFWLTGSKKRDYYDHIVTFISSTYHWSVRVSLVTIFVAVVNSYTTPLDDKAIYSTSSTTQYVVNGVYSHC